MRREDDPIEVDDDEDLRVMIEGWEMSVDDIRVAVMTVSLHLMFANCMLDPDLCRVLPCNPKQHTIDYRVHH